MKLNTVLICVLLFFGTMAQAQLQLTNDVLVFLKSEPNLQKFNIVSDTKARHEMLYRELVRNAQQSQASLMQLLKAKGFKTTSYYISNMILVENATRELVLELHKRSEVRKLSLNQPFLQKILPQSPPSLGTQVRGIEPSLVAIGADKVWNELQVKGQNIVIAGQDSGVQWNHPALIRQYRGSTTSGVQHDYNWHDAIKKRLRKASARNRCGYNLKVPCDDQGHGTHTMGTMVGDDLRENKIGVAPEARWMACRNMDGGVGTPATYIECFEYFFAPYPYGGNPLKDGQTSRAPHVINNSWGCPKSEGCQGEEILPILEKLYTAGIMVVASAGNEGPGCSTINDQPATHSRTTLSVGAMGAGGKIANFSSRGPSKFDGGIGPDIVAPGTNIRSSVPGNKYEGGWNGTSMAGPHVAGLVALMWSARPELIGHIDLTTQIIQKTATPIQAKLNCGGVLGTQIPNNVYGFGMINALRAVQVGLQIK